MNMMLLQCEMCSGELEISLDRSIGVCKYCGSTFTIPKAMEKKGNMFNRANYLRQNCNFDKAIGVYEMILADDCQDADALWGLVLCRYGIEFVEDPATKTRIPTCHRASKTSILLDPDFKSALQFADEEKRAVYLANAEKIDSIQKSLIALSETQEKYDVFICYKETDESGERTVDSVLAQEVYNELTKMNVKTFFSRKSLEKSVGSNYEPIIYSALNSAQVMIVIGTTPEHFEATWVKNEWGRYLKFMREDENKHIIPAYKNISAYQLPDEFLSIQAVDMSKIGAIMDLCDGVKKLLKKEEQPEVSSSAAPVSKDSLYSRAMIFLGNREFYKAVDYFEKVLDIDPSYSRAYWGSLLASYQCVTNNDLVNCTYDDWTTDLRFINALQFASEEERKIYEDILKKRVANFKKLAMSALEAKDFAKCKDWCDKYVENNAMDGSMWWIKLLVANGASNSNELFIKCLETCNVLGDSMEYKNAVRFSIPEEAKMYESTVGKIDAAVWAKRRDIAYAECDKYMVTSIHKIQTAKHNNLLNQRREHENEEDAFSALISNKGHFYCNNFFAIVFRTMFWAIPLYLCLAYLFAENGNHDSFPLTFGILFGIVTVIVLFVSFIKYVSAAGRSDELMKRCNYIVSEQKRAFEMMQVIDNFEEQAKKLHQNFKTTANMNLLQIAIHRDEFQLLLTNFENKTNPKNN